MHAALIEAYHSFKKGVLLTVEETSQYIDNPKVANRQADFDRFCFVFRHIDNVVVFAITPIEIAEAADTIALAMRLGNVSLIPKP